MLVVSRKLVPWVRRAEYGTIERWLNRRSARRFGRELGKYLRLNPIGNASDAWRHIYKLLLSVDRRTRLAHVYDSNHMQRGGNFYDRAVRFTDLLCGLWGITKNDLSTEIDFMFKGCVEEYLKQRQMKAKKLEAAPEVETPEELEEVETEFKLDVRKILETELGISDPRSNE